MYVFGSVRSGPGDNPKRIRGACVRSAGRVDNAGCVVPSLIFIIGIIKNKDMYNKKFANLSRKLSIQREKALEPIKKARMEFYVELTKDLYRSNKLDCSRDSDKCRRKRISYMANKLRQ